MKFDSIDVSDKLLLTSVTKNLILLKQCVVHFSNSASELSEIQDSESFGFLMLSEL